MARYCRRNLHPDQISYLRGKRYNGEKMTKADAGAIGGSSKHQNDVCLESTSQRLADEYKVSKPTIERDGQFAAAVDTLAQAGIEPQKACRISSLRVWVMVDSTLNPF